MRFSGLLKFLAASLLIAVVFYQWQMGRLTTDDDEGDKMLGLARNVQGFGVYELLFGVAAAGSVWLGSSILRRVPGIKKFAPAAQSPVAAK